MSVLSHRLLRDESDGSRFSMALGSLTISADALERKARAASLTARLISGIGASLIWGTEQSEKSTGQPIDLNHSIVLLRYLASLESRSTSRTKSQNERACTVEANQTTK